MLSLYIREQLALAIRAGKLNVPKRSIDTLQAGASDQKLGRREN